MPRNNDSADSEDLSFDEDYDSNDDNDEYSDSNDDIDEDDFDEYGNYINDEYDNVFLNYAGFERFHTSGRSNRSNRTGRSDYPEFMDDDDDRTTNMYYRESLYFNPLDILSLLWNYVGVEQQPVSQGLDAAFRKRFPVHKFNVASGKKAPWMPPGDPLCAICMTNYQSKEKVRVMPCSHHFHMDCIDCWLDKKPTCPICRFDFPDSKVNL